MTRFAPRELILGAGAVKGFALAGVIKAVEEWQIPITSITGVSMGSIVATLYANGYGHEEIVDLLCQELEKLDLPGLSGKIDLPRIGSFLRYGGLFEIESLFRDLAPKYNLHPQHHLKLLACSLTRQPVLFTGVNYDLPLALAASCAVPILFRPVRIGGRLLIDGGLYNSAPVDFCTAPAIVGRLGLAQRKSGPSATWIDSALHQGEIFIGRIKGSPTPNPPHILVQAGKPDVATLTFGLREKHFREMVDYGYQATIRSLEQAQRQGVL